MTKLLCDQCGLAFEGEGSTRRVHRFCGQPCWALWRRALPRQITPVQMRRLRDDEPLPTGTPRRFRTRDGYWLVRWKVGTRSYVEALEHRMLTGRQTPVVHHKNRHRDDNRPENLQPVTSLEHGAQHSRINLQEAVALYAAGWSLPTLARRYVVHDATVLRFLRRRGVVLRTLTEAWQVRKSHADEARPR